MLIFPIFIIAFFTMNKKLHLRFYQQTDVVKIAHELVGKLIVSNIDHKTCIGKIVETEAYIGLTDRASHSFNGKRTSRNEHMYAAPGTAYVYTCYGIHDLLNIVTNKVGVPDAILLRAIEPLEGLSFMEERTGKKASDRTITRGPGNLARALGISKLHSGISYLDDELFLCDGFKIKPEEIGSSSRIGCESAGEAAHYPYRFYLKGNPYVSGRPTK
jgi:DNA-3-methyladenine glycosylase